MTVWSLKGLVIPWRNEYELWVLQEAAVGVMAAAVATTLAATMAAAATMLAAIQW